MLRKILTKQERLSGKIAISKIFDSGESFFLHPFMVFFCQREDDEWGLPSRRILVSVSKRHFKRAVARNLVKRRIKEAYRLNKASYDLVLKEKSLDIALVYVSKEIHSYSMIEKRLCKAIDKMSHLI